MRTVATVFGARIALGGMGWIAQGLNLPFAPRSFMTADRTWIVRGSTAAVLGAGLISWAR